MLYYLIVYSAGCPSERKTAYILRKRIPNTYHNQNNIRYHTMAQSIDINQVIEHFKTVLTTQYFCFDGRMSKRDYWTFMIPALIINCVLGVTVIVPLALLLPTLGATARRLHDVGKTGWLQLIGFVCPPIGSIIVLLMCLPDGNPEANQYGEPPVAEDAEASDAE